MKKIIIAVALMLAMLILVSCESKKTDETVSAKLVFNPFGEGVSVTLTPEESARVAEIIKSAEALPPGEMLTCGFSTDVSITIDDVIYCIGRDGCGSLECGILYFNISDSDADEIHAIFEKYGGRFPCI